MGLYVHIPWCVRKCPYCDFNSHALRGDLPGAAYVSALLADLAADAGPVAGRPVDSVFIGGGTPSLLEPAQLRRLLAGIGERLELTADCEITLEANPGAVDARRFAGYRAAGVNRLSIGVQSFDDRRLAALGRIHDGAAALTAFARARAAGFDNLNLDLMFGLPGQTLEDALTDLQTALELAPEHLSWYQLTLEPNTAFQRAPPPLPAHEAVADMQEAGQARLAAAELRQYEVSAYARPGRNCRHNTTYWTFGDYLGIGAGAHGKLTRADGRIERRHKVRHPTDYLAAAGRPAATAGARELTVGELGVEFMLNALRLREGVDEALFEARTGQRLALLAAPLAEARARGLLAADRLRATDLGWRFLDDLVSLFEPA
ncbi:MAG: radical SAM family heme chaperone HemW [Gammaproteobacteria bacterium]